jgi:FSR family fosmidomycin resistance protein-like MFS transporter
MTEKAEKKPQHNANGSTLLAALTSGHIAVHWYQQLWPMIIPAIKSSLGLTDMQLGILASVKQFTTGPLFLPAGILADFFRRRTAVILATAFLFFGISHFLVALSPNFFWIVPSVALLGIGTALWHPAALGSLSLRFPERRGSALATHGVGASIGDTIAPIAIGYLLLSLTWQSLLKWQLTPALLLAAILWKWLGPKYKNLEDSRPSMSDFWRDAINLLRNRVVLAIIGVNVLTGMGRISIMTFLPIYIQDDLSYSAFGLGFYWGLLHAMGAISQPAMGYLSDKFGRKAVLVPSLLVLGVLYLLLAVATPGTQLILVIGALGLFFYALATITQATVMDVASSNVQASTMGIVNIFAQFLTLPSPIIAGFLVTSYGTVLAFVYAGVLTLAAALLLLVVHVPRSQLLTQKTLG